jgi:signal transduction histidine kinase/uncharacterized membrane-anchored protein YhcB (DUF1043 family)
MPLYTTLVLHPAYHQELVQNTEEESVRFANYLLRTSGLDGVRLQRGKLPAQTMAQIELSRQDYHLTKLRFFSAEGEIIFSTDTAEIGEINDKDYFRNVVAKGQVYSKVVSKDKRTADGVVTKTDLVETYVPFLVSGYFSGAIEVYYDITERAATINRLTVRTTLLLLLFSGIFLGALLLALNKAQVSLKQRQEAEDALQRANEQLENRVAERTAELSDTNIKLIGEVAERTMAQRALSQALEESRHEREKLDSILRSVTDGMVVTDGNLAIIHMNAFAEKVFDASLDKLLGQPLARLTGGGRFPARIRDLLAVPQDGQIFDLELPGQDPQRPFVYQCLISRMVSDLKSPGVVMTIQDVTRERELDRMKNAFLGMAAHELNTPLAAILGFTEMMITPDICAQLTEEQRQESLALVHSKALELSRLIDDLLDISRVEAGQPLVLDYETVRLEQLIHEVLTPYQEKQTRHDFEIHMAAPELELAADRGRLRQVLNNLISNAVKYSPQGGTVRITVSGEGQERCLLTVTDQGIGMSADQVAHVFDRFYRVDASNTAVKGVGLGMSIVRNIVLAHGGDIRVESQPGVGTTIYVALPLREPPAPAT